MLILYFNYNKLKDFFCGILVELNSLAEHPLSLYIEEFEKPYLKHTRRYYERESAAVIANASISEYMRKVLICSTRFWLLANCLYKFILFVSLKQASQRLNEEEARNLKYCHPSSHETVR